MEAKPHPHRSSRSSSSKRPGGSSSNGGSGGGGASRKHGTAAEWTREEVSALKRAVREVPTSVEKQERWRRIADIVGRGKRECYHKYKAVKEAREAAKRSQSAASRSEEKSGGSGSCKEEDHHPATKGPKAMHRHLDAHPGAEVSESKQASLHRPHQQRRDDAHQAGGVEDDTYNPRYSRTTATATVGSDGIEQSYPYDPHGFDRASRQPQSQSCYHQHGPDLSQGVREMQLQDFDSDSGSSSDDFSAARFERRSRLTQGEEGEMAIEEYDFNHEDSFDRHATSREGRSVLGAAQQEAERSAKHTHDDVTCGSTRVSATTNPSSGGSGSQRGPGGTDGGRGAPFSSRGAPLETASARGLQSLLFGDRKPQFLKSWLNQGFFFCQQEDLRYGLVQNEGGPCGVLAAVNAFVVRRAMMRNRPADPREWGEVDPRDMEDHLVDALVDVLVQAASGSIDGGQGAWGATLCLASLAPNLPRTSASKFDGVTERIRVLPNIRSRDALHRAVCENLRVFTHPGGLGAAMLLCSVMLSRGIERVKGDMDEGFAGEVRSLLDRHGYLSQEGVNLILVGRGVSNVFDGNRRLEDSVQGSADAVTLGGIPQRSEVGFLSIHEAYRYMEVGRNLKDPVFPVWVVFSESHYSLFFSASDSHKGGVRREVRDADAGAELLYWDMLGKQRETILLSVKPNDHGETIPDPHDESDLIPPLDLVIRTNWNGMLVDWNSTEPLL